VTCRVASNNSLQLTGPAAEKRLIRKRIRLARQLSSRPFGGGSEPSIGGARGALRLARSVIQ
jgi:hypothetical protein